MCICIYAYTCIYIYIYIYTCKHIIMYIRSIHRHVFSPYVQASSLSVRVSTFLHLASQLEQCTFKRLFGSESATGKVPKSTENEDV